jgi:integrase
MGIKRRGKNWHCDFVAPDGRRVRQALKTTDRREAQELYDGLRSQAWRIARLGEKPRRTWKEGVVRYLRETEGNKSRYTDVLRLQWLDRSLGNKFLDEVTPDVIQALVEAKLAEGVKPATVNHMLHLVRTIGRRAALDWQWLDRAPKVRMLPTRNERTRVLTDTEEAKLVAALPVHLRDPARFALATGLRKGNVFGLRWQWVDMERAVLTIPASDMKAGAAVGIPLTQDAMAVLRKNRGQHPEFVFTHGGTPLRGFDSRTWKKVCKRAGLQDVVWHDFRRTWASRLARAGVPMDVLMRLGAWKTYAVVTKRYAHHNPESLRKYADAAARPLVHVTNVAQ